MKPPPFVVKGSRRALCSLFLLFSVPLSAATWSDYGLRGRVKSLKNARASFEYQFGEWDLSDFFPYSNRLASVCDLNFDSNGNCVRENYCLPSGKSRYRVAFGYKKQGKGRVEDRTAFDFISQEGGRLRLYYDANGQKTRSELFNAHHEIAENRYFFYDGGLLEHEEAFGMTDQLFQKIYYEYDDQRRLSVRKEWLFPYRFQFSKTEYAYADNGKIGEERLYQFDGLLKERRRFHYNALNQLEKEVVFSYDSKETPPKQTKFFWEVDEKGNWIQKTIVEVVFLRNRWVDLPKYVQCRTILYY